MLENDTILTDGSEFSNYLKKGPNVVKTLTSKQGVVLDIKSYWSVTIYYPDTSPHLSEQSLLPGFAMCPGFLGGKRHMQQWVSFIASHGIVTATVETKTIMDSPEKRARALLAAIDTIIAEGNRTNSPLYGRIDSERMAVSGWSMGGGGALIASKLRPSIKTIVCIAPWLSELQNSVKKVAKEQGIKTWPSTEQRRDEAFVERFKEEFPDRWREGLSIPVLFFGGEHDTTAPVDIHINSHYDVTNVPKMRVIFSGDGHVSGVWPEQANSSAGQIMMVWLRMYLLENEVTKSIESLAPMCAKTFDYELLDGVSGSVSNTNSEDTKTATSYGNMDFRVTGYFSSWLRDME